MEKEVAQFYSALCKSHEVDILLRSTFAAGSRAELLSIHTDIQELLSNILHFQYYHLRDK